MEIEQTFSHRQPCPYLPCCSQKVRTSKCNPSESSLRGQVSLALYAPTPEAALHRFIPHSAHTIGTLGQMASSLGDCHVEKCPFTELPCAALGANIFLMFMFGERSVTQCLITRRCLLLWQLTRSSVLVNGLTAS